MPGTKAKALPPEGLCVHSEIVGGPRSMRSQVRNYTFDLRLGEYGFERWHLSLAIGNDRLRLGRRHCVSAKHPVKIGRAKGCSVVRLFVVAHNAALVKNLIALFG